VHPHKLTLAPHLLDVAAELKRYYFALDVGTKYGFELDFAFNDAVGSQLDETLLKVLRVSYLVSFDNDIDRWRSLSTQTKDGYQAKQQSNDRRHCY